MTSAIARLFRVFVPVMLIMLVLRTGDVQAQTTETRLIPAETRLNLSSGSRNIHRRLDNGLNVIVFENNSCGLVAAEFVFKVGNMEGMDTNAGITTIIEDLILATKTDDGLPLQASLEREGCIINGNVEPDYVRISLLCTRDIFNASFRKIVKAIKNPSFDAALVDEVKEDKIFEVESNQNAYRMIHDLFLKEFYRFHPYRTPVEGMKTTLERLTPETLEKFYRDFYTANRLTVSIAGDVNGPDTLEMAKALLQDIPKNVTNKVVIPWEPVAQEKKLYMVTSSSTAWLFVGFPAPEVKSPDYPKMLMLEGLLSQGLSARLFIELREKEGLAYELSSDYPKLEGPSHLIMYVMSNGKNLGRCRTKFFNEIKRVKTELISEEELEATRRKVLGKLLMDRESNRDRAFYNAYFASLGLGADYDRTLMDKISIVTAQDIQNVARKYLQNYTVLIIESAPNMKFDED